MPKKKKNQVNHMFWNNLNTTRPTINIFFDCLKREKKPNRQNKWLKRIDNHDKHGTE